MHGDADRLADAELDDALRRVPALVLLGVAGEHAFLVLHDVVEDRAADVHVLGVARLAVGFAVAADAGTKLAGLAIDEHDAAAVGLDPFEDQLHDAAQELVDVERVADGERRAIHHLQVAVGAGEPVALRLIEVEREELAALLLPHGAEDAGLFDRGTGAGGTRVAYDADALVEAAGGGVAGAGEEHDGATHLDLVAAGELMALDLEAVDVGSVGAGEVGQDEHAARRGESRHALGRLRSREAGSCRRRRGPM